MRRADLFVALCLVIGAGVMAQRYAEPSSYRPKVAGLSATHSGATLRVGVEGAFPPFNEKRPDGRLEGLDIDVAEALCASLERNCIFVIRPWREIVDGLANRDYDAIVSSMRITPVHDGRIAFTRPYYRTPGRFAVRKDSAIAKADEQSLRGMRVGVAGGTLHQRFLEAHFAQAQITPLGTAESAQEGLATGAYEVIFGDSTALYRWLKSPQGACCRLLDPGFDEERFFGRGVAVALRAQDHNLRKRADQALQHLQSDGTLKSITARYFPFPLL